MVGVIGVGMVQEWIPKVGLMKKYRGTGVDVNNNIMCQTFAKEYLDK